MKGIRSVTRFRTVPVAKLSQTAEAGSGTRLRIAGISTWWIVEPKESIAGTGGRRDGSAVLIHRRTTAVLAKDDGDDDINGLHAKC